LAYYVTYFSIWLKVVQSCSEFENKGEKKKDEKTVSFFVSGVSPSLHLPLFPSCLALDAIKPFWYNNAYNEGIRILENNGETALQEGFPPQATAFAQRLRRRYPKGGGNPVIADRGCVRPPIRKGKGQRSIKSEANTVPVRVGVG